MGNGVLVGVRDAVAELDGLGVGVDDGVNVAEGAGGSVGDGTEVGLGVGGGKRSFRVMTSVPKVGRVLDSQLLRSSRFSRSAALSGATPGT